MASIRRYKCLNPSCTGATSQNYTHIFGAMNNEAKCPACACIKLEDWGQGDSLGWEKIRSASSSVHDMSAFNRTNDSIQEMADRGGLSNMTNKDGKAVLGAQSHSGPTVAVGGIQVPMSAVQSGACVNVPSMAQKLTGKWNGSNGAGSLKSQTEVVA